MSNNNSVLCENCNQSCVVKEAGPQAKHPGKAYWSCPICSSWCGWVEQTFNNPKKRKLLGTPVVTPTRITPPSNNDDALHRLAEAIRDQTTELRAMNNNHNSLAYKLQLDFVRLEQRVSALEDDGDEVDSPSFPKAVKT